MTPARTLLLLLRLCAAAAAPLVSADAAAAAATDLPPVDDLLWGSSIRADGARSDVSVAGLRKFATRTVDLCKRVASGTRENVKCEEGWTAAEKAEKCPRQHAKQEFVVMMRENMWIPTIASILYAIAVHGGPMIMAHLPALPLGPVLALWNLALAVFSTVGAYHCMSGLIYNAMRNSWRYTVCTLPETIELHNTDMDLWACFFVLSKIAEFFDTILKVLMKKNFIFLHWYHHLATAYFCWLSVAYNYAPGLWIAALNFSVHAPMYTYYFLSSTLNKKWFTMICKPVAPLVTTLQISQMVTFTIVNVFAVYSKWYDKSGEECSITFFNLSSNAVLVFTYLVLFVILFINKYLTKPAAKKAKSKSSGSKSRARSPSPAARSSKTETANPAALKQD